MRLGKKISYISCVFGLLFFQCTKDRGILLDTGACQDLPPSTSSFGYQYQQPEISYNAPCFNPSNPNEIIYVRGHYSTGTSELRRYDLITHKDTILCTNIWENPKWGKNGWIVFNHADNQVWKIKCNGDSLTQMTTQGGLGAVWNGAGDKIAYWNQISSTYYTYIMNPSGIYFDTLLYPDVLYRGAWSPDNLKLGTAYSGNVAYIDLNNKMIHSFNSAGAISINGMDWLPNSQTIIWCSDKGMFRTDISTNTTKKLKSGCSSKIYLWPSVSSDGSKIIVQRIDQNLIGDNTVFSESHLYTMNVDGTGEKKIE